MLLDLMEFKSRPDPSSSPGQAQRDYSSADNNTDGSTIETLVKGDEFSEDRIRPRRECAARTAIPRAQGRQRRGRLTIACTTLYPERVVTTTSPSCVRKGEVWAFWSEGAGKTERAMSIFGPQLRHRDISARFTNGEKVNLKSPEDAIHHKLAYVTEDRKTNGLILDESIRSIPPWPT